MKTKLSALFVALTASICSLYAYETLSVAQAMEIGRALDKSAKSADTYLITGYVVAIESEYNEQYHNQCYWISDQPEGEISDVFYIYRGGNDNAVQVGNKISIEAKVFRYNNLVIENSGSPVTILDEAVASAPAILTGNCGETGDNLTFQLNLSTWDLTIQGSGAMVDTIADYPWQWQNMRKAIQTIQLPEGLTMIGTSAFENCEKVNSVVIPEGVTSIGRYAFSNCSALTTMNMPESVHNIGKAAFQGCILTEPLYNSRLFCFLPMDYSGSYAVPDGIVAVISYSFDGRIGLTSVDLPASVLRLGYRTFRNCKGLQSITCRAVEPPTSQGESFEGVDKSIPLYIPAGSLELYQEADEWSEFTNREALPDEPETPETPEEDQALELTNAPLPATHKLFHNGQLLILRANRTYTLTGQAAE